MKLNKAPYVFGLVALLGSTSALAVSIQNVTIQTGAATDVNSDHVVWVSDGIYAGTGGISPLSASDPAPGTESGRKAPSYDGYLVGSSAAPGSNIELSTLDDGIGSPDFNSWLGGTSLTTLTGDFGGTNVVASSLVLSDWTANSNGLAEAYLSGFLDTLGITLTPAQLQLAAYAFVTGDTDGNMIPDILSPAYILSDPNFSYINMEGDDLVIGLAGVLDATSYLQDFADAVGITLTPPTALSEVAKVEYDGVTTYVYGFEATDSRQDLCFEFQTEHAECSYSGNYEVTIPGKTVPEPATAVLFGLGIAGLALRRRRSR